MTRTTRKIATLSLAVALTGCISMDVPDEISYSKTWSTGSVGCNEPYELTFGCNSWNIANIDYGAALISG